MTNRKFNYEDDEHAQPQFYRNSPKKYAAAPVDLIDLGESHELSAEIGAYMGSMSDEEDQRQFLI
jgi:hypothetical protein